MISGSNEKELDIANQIADLLLEKEKLEQENKQLKEKYENVLIANKKLIKEFEDYQNIIIRMSKQKYKAIEYIKYIDDWDIKDFVREDLLKILEDKENINNNAEDIEDLDARITRAEEQYDKQKEEMILGEKE